MFEVILGFSNIYFKSSHGKVHFDIIYFIFYLFIFSVPANSTYQIPPRSSKKSAVTIPLKDLIINADEILSKVKDGNSEGYCGCGWPEYMLIPKGTTAGMRFTLFVMISNYEEDKVNNTYLSSRSGFRRPCRPLPSKVQRAPTNIRKKICKFTCKPLTSLNQLKPCSHPPKSDFTSPLQVYTIY